MGVELRVERTAGVLAEGGGDDPVRVEDADLAVRPVPGVGVALDPVDDTRNGGVVGNYDVRAHRGSADRVQHRDGLRRRAGDVVTARRPLGVPRSEEAASARVQPVHEREELILVDGPVEAELRGAAPCQRPGGSPRSR
jgi:hypothetical protein